MSNEALSIKKKEIRMKTEKFSIPFLGRSIIAFEDTGSGEVLVACRPVAEMIGLNWPGQQQKLMKDPRLMCMLIHTHDSSGRTQEMLCVPKNRLGAWLYSINTNKVKESIAPKLMQFQENIVSVIDSYMHNTLTTELLHQLESIVERQAAEIISLRKELVDERREHDILRGIPTRKRQNPYSLKLA